MNTQRLAVCLTVLNLSILTCTTFGPSSAESADVAPVLRARALEIMDERGRVRAEIRIFPADPTVRMPDGTRGYPETVLLRLIDSEGAPNVKIAATEDGSAVSLGGDSDPTNIQLLARGATTSVKLVNKDGQQQVVKP